MDVEDEGQALLIVSSKPGEGKSTFITNLAVALCRGGEKVVLIDSDMRKAKFAQIFWCRQLNWFF